MNQERYVASLRRMAKRWRDHLSPEYILEQEAYELENMKPDAPFSATRCYGPPREYWLNDKYVGYGSERAAQMFSDDPKFKPIHVREVL